MWTLFKRLLLLAVILAGPLYFYEHHHHPAGATAVADGDYVRTVTYKGGEGHVGQLPYSKVAGESSPTIATQGYVDAHAGPGQSGAFTDPVTIETTGGIPFLDVSMYRSGLNHSNAPRNIPAAQYLSLGYREYGTGSYRMIGFGYRGSGPDPSPVAIGMQETSSSGSTLGDFIVATRNVTTASAPVPRLTVTSLGAIKASTSYLPLEDNDLTTKEYVDTAITKTGRPATPAPGEMYFSTNQHKPEWYTGTKWVYADGSDAQL